MEKYIEGNKAAWEEAFDNRDTSWGADVTERIQNEEYPFFEKEMVDVLRKINTEGKTIGQFCCNNGRELLSLVKIGKAAKGIGFDIAENQVAFANDKARELNLPCKFEAVNIYDIDDRFKEQFDTVIVLNEQHPCTNMLATEGDAEFDPEHRTECHFSYFEHEWTGNGGMYYMTLKSYHSKTFTDFTHSMSEIISGMCSNGIVVTGLLEFDHDISGGFSAIDHSGFPLSMILQGKKLGLD